MAASTISATTRCGKWCISTLAVRGASYCIGRSRKHWNAGAKTRPMNVTPSLPNTSQRAHVWTKALQYLVLAAERSQTLFAMREALHWWDRAVALLELHPRALDERQRLAIYERRGTARAQAGQTRGAVADIRRVVEAARAGGDREKTRDALVRLGMAYRRADAYEEATRCLTEALAESRAMNDVRRAADTLYHLGTVTWSTGLNDQAMDSTTKRSRSASRRDLTISSLCRLITDAARRTTRMQSRRRPSSFLAARSSSPAASATRATNAKT